MRQDRMLLACRDQPRPTDRPGSVATLPDSVGLECQTRTVIEIKPRGFPLEEIAKVLRQQNADLSNLGSADTRDILVRYMEWVANTSLHLRSRMGGVAQLLYTPQYFALSALVVNAPGIRARVDAELRVQAEVLAELIAEVEKLQVHWGIGGQFVVLDTNLLVQTSVAMDEIDWRERFGVPDLDVHLVVPMVVIDELDSLKRVHKTRSGARRSIKFIEEALTAPGNRSEIRRDGPLTYVTIEVLAEPLTHARLPSNDAEIVARAVWLRDLGARVAVGTWDTGMRFRASGERLKVVSLPPAMDVDGAGMDTAAAP
jgi:rRNA-processing protein FCF1